MSASDDIRAAATAITQQITATTAANQSVMGTQSVLASQADTLSKTATALRVKQGKRGGDVSPAIPDALDAVAAALKTEATRLGATGLSGVASSLTAQVDVLGRIATTLEVPTPPPPPPPPPPPVLQPVLFRDRFAGGKKAAAQNGIAWGGVNLGSDDNDRVAIVARPESLSGFSYALTYAGNTDDNKDGVPDMVDDAWVEPRVTFPHMQKLFYGVTVTPDGTYFHRNAETSDNNKGVRFWDREYEAKSCVHVGWSTLPNSDGTSQIIIEYKKANGLTGNYGLGPWTRVFRPGVKVRIGLFVELDPTGGAGSRMRLYVDGKLVKDAPNLAAYTPQPTVPLSENAMNFGYLFGWANSGFNVDTTLYVDEVVFHDDLVIDYTAS